MQNAAQHTPTTESASISPVKRLGLFLLGAAVAGPAIFLYLMKRSKANLTRKAPAERESAPVRSQIELPIELVVEPADDKASAVSKTLPAEKGIQLEPQAPATTSMPYTASTLSDRFHKSDCRWAQNINDENRIYFPNREVAIKQGFQPCGSCTP